MHAIRKYGSSRKTLSNLTAFFQARSDVNAAIENCNEMLEPLQGFAADMESVETWVTQAQELVDEYGHSDKDVESLYQKHQVTEVGMAEVMKILETPLLLAI